MNEAQQRHLAVAARHVDQLLAEADRAVVHWPEIADELHRVRGEVSRFAARFDLDLRAPSIDALHAVRVQLLVASISVAEMRSRSLRAYGPLDDPSARELDSACDALESAIERAQHVVDAA